MSPRRPDDSKSYLTYRHKKGPVLPSYNEKTEKGTDSDLIIESLRQERKRSPLRTKLCYRQSKSRNRGKKNQSSSHRHKDRKESLTPSYRQKDAVDSNSNGSSSSSETDSEKERLAKVHDSKHILKPPKFDGVRSFESFWAQFCNCVEHNK